MIYKPFPNSPRYSVSMCGQSVINTATNHELKQGEHLVKRKATGYKYVTLYVPGQMYKRIAVHRLVAITWLMPRLNAPWVNHKDGNKSNNHVDNLEWSTISENIQHSYDVLGRKIPTGADHWRHGKTVSKETRKAMSDKKKGVRHPKFKGFYIVDGVKYSSAPQAAKVLNTYAKQIITRCRNKPNNYPNYCFESV